MASETPPPATPFRPPAPYPAPGQRAGLLHGLKTLRSQIEGLPPDVFEADAWRPPLPGMPLFVMLPDAIQRIVLTEADQFPFGALFERIMRPVWGKGLLLSKGSDWRTQRRAAAQAFRAADMAALAPFFVTATERALSRWRQVPGGQIDAFDEMKRITFDVILDTMLSGAETFDREGFRRQVKAFFADVNRMRLSYFLRPDAYHERRSSVVSRHRAGLEASLRDLIRLRRMSASRGDLLDLLMAARDPETGDGFSDELLADNLLGFILAGHETTAVALTWTLYLVSAHAPTRERLRAEAEAVIGDSDVSPAHLPRLGFARQVVSEALRLYPPAFLLTRISARDTEICGHRVRAGERVNIPVYAIHRRPSVWSNPHVFDPDRFSAQGRQPGRFEYMPFGGGPRICIGAALAMAEAVTVIVTLLRAADFTPPSPDRVWPQTGLALYPRHGMSMTVRFRPR